jgi:hypothetical protein
MNTSSNDLRSVVANAIYEALVDDVSGSVTTMAAKCEVVQGVVRCEVINYPDAGSVAKWSMTVNVVESTDDYDLLVGAIRLTLEAIKRDSSSAPEPITD